MASYYYFLFGLSVAHPLHPGRATNAFLGLGSEAMAPPTAGSGNTANPQTGA